MGRIKTDMVKRTTTKLVAAHPDKFTKNFDKNKLALKELAEIRSKKLRNVIAGYSVRLKRQEGKSPSTMKKRL
ncbi:30S ribosomal protein S17e [Candidatus Woesearchaeota archaeon]|nr:30S ribosomal protein S17e [Candidatus Woesearchaeota archaeon]